MNVIQNGPSHRVAELARAMAPDPFSREKLDFLKLGFQDNQYEELEALRCKDRRHNGHCNCVHRYIISSGDVPSGERPWQREHINSSASLDRFKRVICIHNEALNLKNTRNPVAGRKYSEAFSDFVTVHKKELTQNKICKKAISTVLHCSLNFLYRDQNNNKRRVPRIEDLVSKRCCDRECLSRVIRENDSLIRCLLQELENNQGNETKRKMFYQLRRNSLCLKAIGEITTQSKATLNSLNSKEEDQAIVHKLKDKSKTNSRSHTVEVKPEPGLNDQTSYAPTPSTLPETILRAPLPLISSSLIKLPFAPKSLPPTTFQISANVQAAAPRDRLEGISDSREAPPIQLQTPYAIYPPQPFQGFRDAPNIISPSIYPVETSPGIRSPLLKHLPFSGKRKKPMPGLEPIDDKNSPSYKGKPSVLEYSALKGPTVGISPLKKPLPSNPIDNFELTLTPKKIDIITPTIKPITNSTFIYPDTH